MASQPTPLSVDQVFRACRDEELPFQHTGELDPLDHLVGQPRAEEALKLGLSFRRAGYNIFVAGPPGTGKRTFVLEELRALARSLPTPPDLVYLYNFDNPQVPNAVQLPPGTARKLKQDMEQLIRTVRDNLQQAFQSDTYARARQEVTKEAEFRKQQVLEELQRKAQALGFQVQAGPFGLMVIPLWEGRPLNPQEFQQLPPESRQAIEQQRRILEDDLQQTVRRFRQIDQETQEKLSELDRQTAQQVIEPLVRSLQEGYADVDEIPAYLRAVEEDLYHHFRIFLQTEPLPPGPQNPLRRYQVNIMVDNSDLKGAPVIYEVQPSFTNLAGRIEREAVMGVLQTDFTLIRPGAFHRANGGYLVLDAMELFRYPWAYDVLKQVLKTGEIKIQDPGERLGMIPTRGPEPEPVPFSGKVVLLGDHWIYHLLYMHDPDFPEIVKVKSPFDVVMDRTPEHILALARFVARLTQEGDLLPFHRSAIARLVEYASRLSEDQDKLTLRFSEIADLVEEAHFFAREEGAEQVEARHVDTALEKRMFRLNLMEEKILERIARGDLVLHLDGEEVGSVNGLAVYDLGDYAFARPHRITARATLGRAEGILNIEKEAGLSGKIHNKAVLILSGYFKTQYGGQFPLSLSAQLAFEQSYGMLEGDSASIAELMALLSAVGQIPLRQDLAVTGSINQLGEVQPVGGVNEKVEGFYRACKARGLTGRQGVILPAQNVRNLMLTREVREAVAEGRFHLYAVAHIDQVIPLLSGLEPGTRNDDGSFDPDTFHGRVYARLRTFYERLRPQKREGENTHSGPHG